ncbi:MAG: LCP family protein [Clostridia bacterium]|nr:LCP family protein [Clostridia bacterium]
MRKTQKKSKKTDKKNNVLTIVGGIAVGLILVFAIIAVDLFSKMGIISFKDDPSDEPTGFVEVTEPGEEGSGFETLEELRGVNNLSDYLKNWAENSSENSIMKNDDVINFLLIGLDESKSNSDAIIIASLNKEQEKIYLHSVFRDSYTYIKTAGGDEYAKINACYANGGPEKLIEMIEGNFKIDIDHYVSVNFDSFSSIVDILGGIKLDVKAYEANAIRSELGIYCPSGEDVLLNGEQALGFCRIRHCDVDADVSRTRRQRMFINELINEAKDISISQISPLLNTVIKYIKTDCSVGDILSLGTQALTNKWYNYEIVSSAIPSEEHRMDYRGNAWVWIVDYPATAQALQNTIYGMTNIELKEDRVSAIDIMKNTHDTGIAAP